MITREQLLQALACIAPEKLAASWDNGGVQIMTEKKEIHTVLTALDVTEEVVREALQRKADWIVTHHPLFFKEIKKLDEAEPAARLAMRLIRHDISLYAAHTAFDCAPGGNNDRLAALLDLHLEREESEESLRDDFLYISKPLDKPLSFDMLCAKIRNALGPQGSLVFAGEPPERITRIAICTGSGADLMKTAKASGADVLITGDLKYHAALDAKQMLFCVIDAGHFGTEKFFSANMAGQLKQLLKNQVNIIISESDTDPFRTFRYFT